MRPKKPKADRPTTEDEQKALKHVTRRCLKAAGGGNGVEALMRVDASKLSDYHSIGNMGSFMPVDVVADLERLVEYPLITEHLAQMQGYRLVPDTSDADQPDMDDVSDLSDAQGRLLSMLIKAGADGHFSLSETREILPVAEALKLQLDSMIKGLKGVSS